MSTHALAFTIDVGITGLTLKAALYTAGTIHATVRDVTTGMTEIGQGFYEWLPSVIPDGYQGTAVFYTGTVGVAANFTGVTVYAAASVNPTESGSSDPENPVIVEPDPGLCRIYGTMLKPDGEPAANVTVTATLRVPRSKPAVSDGGLVSGRTASTTTDENGEFELDVIQTDEIDQEGCTYDIECEDADFLRKRVAITTTTLDIATLVA